MNRAVGGRSRTSTRLHKNVLEPILEFKRAVVRPIPVGIGRNVIVQQRTVRFRMPPVIRKLKGRKTQAIERRKTKRPFVRIWRFRRVLMRVFNKH